MRRAPRPFLYFLLFLPFNAAGGYIAVAIGYLGPRHGLSVQDVAQLGAIYMLPQTWKCVWAPLTDALWRRKGWYVTSTVLAAGALAAMGFVPLSPANLPTLYWLAIIGSVASTFVGMSIEAIMAHATPPEQLGRAAGWSQAGNLGGTGVGGGLGLYLARTLPEPWMATSILGAVMVSACAALLLVPDPGGGEGHLGQRVRSIARDLWSVVASRRGVVAIALCFLPMGAGAASGVFAAAADAWRASAVMVEWMNGWVSGGVSALGCLLGGWLSDRMSRKGAYALGGAILAGVALAMGLAPKAPWAYASLGMAYNLATGVCYGAFTGFVLEVIGKGAAATKYNIFASLSNIPITYMLAADGWVAERHGVGAMLLFDAAAGIAGLGVLFGVVLLVRPRAVDAPPPGVTG